MLLYQTIIQNLLNYDLANLIEIERYICFDNNAKYSTQASPNNCDNNKENSNKILTYQINTDSKEYNNISDNINSGVVITSEDISNNTVFDSW
ncbi:15308_t:CDS:1, partial [Racocetra persica]